MVSKQPSLPRVFTTLDKRQKALGISDHKKGDPIVDHLVANAETLYFPKEVTSKHDWLFTQKERGQSYPEYM